MTLQVQLKTEQDFTEEFIQLALESKVLKFGKFTLKSGRVSPYFFNAGLLATGESLSLLAKGYADALVKRANLSANTKNQELVIFGAAYKGIPFVAATAQALWDYYQINVSWGYNRKEAKTHGEGGTLVGADVSGKSVWILDDVITAGTAMRQVIDMLKRSNAQVAGILVALDRKEKGQNDTSAIQELQTDLSVPVEALVDIDNIISYLQAKDEQENLVKMQAYRKKFGV